MTEDRVYHRGDRVRALIPFGPEDDEEHVPVGGLGTVVDRPGGVSSYSARVFRLTFVAFDDDPTGIEEPWPCQAGDIELVARVAGEA